MKKFLLKNHPEVFNFEDDKYVLSDSFRKYRSDFLDKYSGKFNALERFLDDFSKLELGDSKSLKKVLDNTGYTFTKSQENRINQNLKKFLERYPVDHSWQGQIRDGELIDLSKEGDDVEFKKKLVNFVKKVLSLPRPNKLDLDLQNVGKLPLIDVHNSLDKGGMHDPIIGNSLKRIATFDVSANPGGSIKDIMAKNMLEKALSRGVLRSNGFIVEGTSGNTGVGLAIFALKYGFPCILIIPDKMSQEKIYRLKDFGAHVIVAPTKVSADNPKSYYKIRDFIAEEFGGWQASQYDNLDNRDAHYEVTGPEIWEKTKGEITTLVASAGTCGTISGVARYLKEKNPAIKVVGVDTVGSILYLLKEGYSIDDVGKYAIGYQLQGFGEDIRPENLDLGGIDKFVRISDKLGLNMTRLLVSLGVLGGHSSGSVYAGILELLEDRYIGEEDFVFAIFPDHGVPYRSDVFNQLWMRDNNFKI